MCQWLLPRPQFEKAVARYIKVFAQGLPTPRKRVRQIYRHNLPLYIVQSFKQFPKRHRIIDRYRVHIAFQELQIAIKVIQGCANAPVKQFGNSGQNNDGNGEYQQDGEQ